MLDKDLVHCGNPETICSCPTVLEKCPCYQISWNEQGDFRLLWHPDHLLPNTRSGDVQFVNKTDLSAAFNSGKNASVGLVKVTWDTNEAETCDSLQSHLEARQIIQDIRNGLASEIQDLSHLPFLYCEWLHNEKLQQKRRQIQLTILSTTHTEKQTGDEHHLLETEQKTKYMGPKRL